MSRHQHSFETGGLPYSGEIVLLLGVVLVASIAAGSFLMIAVSALLLAIFGALAYRARAIKRNLDRVEDLNQP